MGLQVLQGMVGEGAELQACPEVEGEEAELQAHLEGVEEAELQVSPEVAVEVVVQAASKIEIGKWSSKVKVAHIGVCKCTCTCAYGR